MKKYLFFLISMVLLVTLLLSGCGPAATEEPTEEEPVVEEPEEPEEPAAKEILAVSLPALDNPLMLGFSDAFTAAFGEQYDVQVVSADGNPNTQATQIENLTTQNAKFLFVMPAEATSLVPKLVAARNAGMMVLAAGGDPGDPDAYDSAMFMNQYLSGVYASYMAKEWVEETYPDAEDGSVETVIFQSSLNEEAVARSMGVQSITEPYLKNVDGEFINEQGEVVSESDKIPNPGYCSMGNVVATGDYSIEIGDQTVDGDQHDRRRFRLGGRTRRRVPAITTDEAPQGQQQDSRATATN